MYKNIVFLKMNIRCSKHVADTKKEIKTLILKSAICWLTLHNCVTIHGIKKHKLGQGVASFSTFFGELIVNAM
jgi:hypothetical protein